MTNKVDDLKAQCTSVKPHIICITEALPKAKQNSSIYSSTINLEGYELFHNFEYQNCHRGLCIYLKAGFECCELTIDEDFTESLWIKVTLGNSEKLLIGVIYRSPSNNEPDYIDQLLTAISTAAEDNSTYKFIVGDFNFRGIQWREHSGDTETNLNQSVRVER